MSSCSAKNGKYCPSRMNDGRIFTDYRPKCIVNADLMQQLRSNNVTASSYDSRMFLQKNAEMIMQKQKEDAYNNMDCACQAYDPNSGIDTMAPEKYVVKCNSVSCYREEVNPNGIGDGRNYF